MSSLVAGEMLRSKAAFPGIPGPGTGRRPLAHHVGATQHVARLPERFPAQGAASRHQRCIG